MRAASQTDGVFGQISVGSGRPKSCSAGPVYMPFGPQIEHFRQSRVGRDFVRCRGSRGRAPRFRLGRPQVPARFLPTASRGRDYESGALRRGSPRSPRSRRHARQLGAWGCGVARGRGPFIHTSSNRVNILYARYAAGTLQGYIRYGCDYSQWHYVRGQLP